MACLPLVVAHDGCEDSVPHTLEAVLRGLAAGADIVEVDIRVTRDGVVVLRHDGSLLVDGEEVSVADIAFAELEDLQRSGRLSDRRAVGKVTRLEEILRAASERGAAVNLDVKEDAVVDVAAEIVRQNDMNDRVVFSGCESTRARALKSRNRDCQVMLNISQEQYRLGMADYDGFVRAVCEDAVEAGCCALNIYHSFCKEELVARARPRYLPVSVWTVDDVESMSRLLELGVYSITTNRVAVLRSLM